MIPARIVSLLQSAVVVANDHVTILDYDTLRESVIDALVHKAIFGPPETRPVVRWLIWEIAQELGVRPSSIHPLYMARARNTIPATFTVPAMNFRGMAYDTARALFQTAVATNSKAFICELARG